MTRSSVADARGETRPRARAGAYAGVVLGVMAVSTAAILIRLAQVDLHSLAVAAWRMGLSAVILAPVALAACRAEWRSLARREWGYIAAAGLLLALHFATWITSLAYASVAASVVLVTTNPLFVGLASHLVLRERLSRAMGGALLIAVVGGALIGLGDLGTGAHWLLGDLLALAGALAAAGYFLIGRRLRARLSLLAYVFPVYGVAALMLIALAAIAGLPMLPRSSQTWAWLLLLAVGPQIVGHSSLNWALRYLSATYVTLAVLLEAVGSTLLAWWLLKETPSPWAAVGGALILVGVAIASRAGRSQEA